MAGLQRHPSLRFSVFELAADIGLEVHAFDGNFDAIVEEDEHQGSLQTSGKQQRRTHSSDELTDPPYPLTPPSSNVALYSPQPLTPGNKKLDEQAKFVERFPTRSPDFLSSPPKGRPTTPRSGQGKLRKTPTSSAANTPISEGLLDFTDSERPRSRKDSSRKDSSRKDKKAPREEKHEKEREKFAKGITAQRDNTSVTAPQSPAEDDEEKKLLGGLLRFRTRSKERKAAAKQAQKLPLDRQNSTPPPRQHTPPPLPIASRFARQREEISFRPQTSESSHGGHQGSSNHSQVASSDSHDTYPRPRDRSSRFERPHPVWRSGPSTLGNIGNAAPREDKERVLPAERHALPPHQSIFDREPAKRPLRIDISNDGNSGGVNMEAVNKYYGLTPEPTHTPAAVTPPIPQSHLTLAQALETGETRPNGHLVNASRSTFAPPAPSSHSPFLVPSPNPTQSEFGAQPRAKRGRMNIPPALDPTFVLPRRLGGAFNPPPTPPPTTDLPPIPTHIPDDPPRYSPYPSVPPSAMRIASTLPLRTRTSNPNLRVEPSTPSPRSPAHQNRNGEISAQESGMAPPTTPLRSLSPVQRGKTPAFPARPVTPTRPAQVSPVSPGRNGNGVGYRREYDPSVAVVDSQKSSLSTEEKGFLRPSRSEQYLSWNNADQHPTPSHVDMQSYSNNVNDVSSPVPPARKRSLRKSNYNPSGYDSDDASSRYSRDTYYGRDTAYFDDQNMPPLPLPSDMPPLPQRDFGDMERERKAGRERLVRMLANGGRDI